MCSLNEEKKLWKKGFRRVACLDEAGRGPLAGPVVAAAVFVKDSRFVVSGDLLSVNDSKKLSAKQREKLFKVITKHSCLEWGIGIVSEKVIDKINILEATKLAMIKALKGMKPDFLILDGKMRIDFPCSQKSIIKADGKVFSCSAASILAKVTRDRIMDKYSGKYPKYGFHIHKGYPTERHVRMLKKHGPCRIHRRSFGPVKEARY